jgi:hypothetical protein
MVSEVFTLTDNGGSIWGKVERNQTTPSGSNAGIIVRGGDDDNNLKNLGLTTANTSSGSVTTGHVFVESGNATGGTANSGNITLKTGTSSGGTRGYVKFDALVAVMPTGTSDPSTSYPDGSCYYNTSTNKIMVLNGGTWRGITLT